MSQRHSRKKWMRRVAITAAVGIALGLALPLWFPLVLRPVLKAGGITVGTISQRGFLRVELRNVEAPFLWGRITAKYAEFPLPLGWIRTHPANRPGVTPDVRVDDWQIVVSNGPTQTNDVTSMAEILDEVHHGLNTLRRWSPSIDLKNGRVEVEGTTWRFPEASWRDGRIEGRIGVPGFAHFIVLTSDIAKARAVGITGRIPEMSLSMRLDLAPSAAGWTATGEFGWRTNHAAVSGTFGRDALWPTTAQLRAVQWTVPAATLRLEGYSDLSGSGTLRWETNRFTLQAEAEAQPLEVGNPFLTPVRTAVEARGTPGTLAIDRLQITAPWLGLNLSAPLEFGRADRPVPYSAELTASLDLAPFRAFGLAGRMTGTVRIEATNETDPTFEFALTGKDLSLRSLSAKHVRAAGRLHWPQLHVESFDVLWREASQSSAQAHLQLDSKTVTEAAWQFHGRLPADDLVPGISLARLEASGRLRGPVADLQHSGTAEATGVVGAIPHPLTAALSWEGRNLDLTNVAAKLIAPGSQLDLGGAIRVTATGGITAEGALKTLKIRDAEGTLTLQQAAAFQFQRWDEPSGNRGADFKLAPLELADGDRNLRMAGQVRWPERGEIQVRARAITLTNFSGLFVQPVHLPRIERLQAEGRWTNGPVLGSLEALVTLGGPAKPEFSAEIGARLTAEGLSVERILVRSREAPAVTAEGELPVVLMPTNRSARIQTALRGPIRFRAQTVGTNAFPVTVGVHGALEIREPSLDLTVIGTFQNPDARLQFRSATIRWSQPGPEVRLPEVTAIEATARVSAGRIQLDRFRAKVNGQAIRVTGEMPYSTDWWSPPVGAAPAADWRQLRAHVDVEDAAVETFSRYLTNVFSPQGRFTLGLDVKPGLALMGDLVLTNMATRPLATLSPIRDIHAHIHFDDHTAIIEQFTGTLGGRSVTVRGRGWLTKDYVPAFAVGLQASNVAVLRKPGLILRSDLDVQLARTNSSPPVLSGRVRLRDGLFLMDIAALMPGKLAVHAPSPASFSITNDPFAHWTVDLRVTGKDFLRVRTPLFTGTLSANVAVRGDLAEPEASGLVRLDSGQVQFPFGTLVVEQGQLNLTGADPRGPALDVIASGRNYRYNIRMEVTGSLQDPLVTFSSTPALSAEQILLMLSAGELPNEEYSYSREAKVGILATFLGKDLLRQLTGDDGRKERLITRSGEDISDEGKTTYSIEYRLTDRWSITGEYDRFNAFNGGVKWRVFSH